MFISKYGKCENCWDKIRQTSPNSKYCDDCAIIFRRRARKKYTRKWNKTRHWIEKNRIKNKKRYYRDKGIYCDNLDRIKPYSKRQIT